MNDKSIRFNILNINTLFFILLIVGFTIISTIPEAFSLNSRIITVPFRALVLSLSIVIIGYNIYTKNSNNFSKTEYFFIAFWLFYIIKAIMSFNVYGFSESIASREVEIYLRIIGITFIPSLAVLTIKEKKIDYKFFFNVVYYTLFLILLLNVIVGIKYDSQGRSAGFMSMYSISFGHLGVSLALLSIFKLLFEFKDKYLTTISIIGSFLGLYILYASGTRSPLIAFIICFSFLLFLKNNAKYIITFLLLLAASVTALIYFKPQYVEFGQASSFFNRVSKMVISGDSSGRMPLYKQGINTFIEHPIFGSRILFFDGVYPHNIFIEIAMATGIIGFILFLFFFKNCINFIIKLKQFNINNVHTVWIGILWLQYFILSLFSYNLHSSPEIWYLTAMVLVLNKKQLK